MQQKSNLKLKYCPILDTFVKIKELTSEDVETCLARARISDKQSYQEFVVFEAMPECRKTLRSLFDRNDDTCLDRETAIEELYRMCVKVNGALNIYNVTIPVHEEKSWQGMCKTEESIDRSKRMRRIAGLEKTLKKRVVGQDRAIDIVARSVRSAWVGIRDWQRPVATLVFAGQTGVGKTELAKALAEFITGDEKHMVRVDCSEFSQPHEYAKLIGAPPGYVGYDDGGTLTEPLLKNPQTVVLFDEIEKANEKVHNLLLQVMDEGFLTDNKGRRIPFQEAVVILTSNVGVESLEEMGRAVGFTSADTVNERVVERETVKSLESLFRPEFLNRVDEVVCFRSLSPGDNRRIVRMLLQRLKENLADLKMSIRFSAGVVDYLVKKGTDPRYGARPLRRAIKQYIEAPLADRLITESLDAPANLAAKMFRGDVVFVGD